MKDADYVEHWLEIDNFSASAREKIGIIWLNSRSSKVLVQFIFLTLHSPGVTFSSNYVALTFFFLTFIFPTAQQPTHFFVTMVGKNEVLYRLWQTWLMK